MKIKLNKKRKVTRTICSQTFSLVPYINLSQKEYILNKLVEYYNESKEESFTKLIMELRANLDVLVLQAVTDIEVDEDSSYEDMISSGLIELIKKSIINYDEIYQDAFYFLQTTKLMSLLPDTKSLTDSFSSLPKMFENMSSEQKENLNMVVKASLANSASNSILGAIKDDQ